MRIAGSALRTPLVRLNVEDAPASIWLKLENLQPIGSFKIRGAGNAMGLLAPSALARGVYTASAGNMAQGVAWNARRLGVPCTVVVPEHAPQTKLAAIERLGAAIVKIPFDAWWNVIVTHHHPGIEGMFIHPVSDPNVIWTARSASRSSKIFPTSMRCSSPTAAGACRAASRRRSARCGRRQILVRDQTAAPLAAPRGISRQVDYTHSSTRRREGVLEEIRIALRRILRRFTGRDRGGGEELVEQPVVAEGAGVTLAAALAGKAGAARRSSASSPAAISTPRARGDHRRRALVSMAGVSAKSVPFFRSGARRCGCPEGHDGDGDAAASEHIVLVTIDTWRADALRLRRRARRTPNLDAFAWSGWYCASVDPATLTARPPPAHGAAAPPSRCV